MSRVKRFASTRVNRCSHEFVLIVIRWLTLHNRSIDALSLIFITRLLYVEPVVFQESVFDFMSKWFQVLGQKVS